MATDVFLHSSLSDFAAVFGSIVSWCVVLGWINGNQRMLDRRYNASQNSVSLVCAAVITTKVAIDSIVS